MKTTGYFGAGRQVDIHSSVHHAQNDRMRMVYSWRAVPR